MNQTSKPQSNRSSKERKLTIIAMLAVIVLAIQSFSWLVFILLFAFYLFLIMIFWAAVNIKFYFNSALPLKDRLFSPSIITIVTCVTLYFLFYQSVSAIKNELLIEGKAIQKQCQIEHSCPRTPKGFKATNNNRAEVEREMPIWLFSMPYSVRYAKKEDHFLLRVFYAPDGAVMVRGGINEEVK